MVLELRISAAIFCAFLTNAALLAENMVHWFSQKLCGRLDGADVLLMAATFFGVEPFAVAATPDVLLLEVGGDAEAVPVAAAVEYRAAKDDALALHSRQTYPGRTTNFIVELMSSCCNTGQDRERSCCKTIFEVGD